MNRIRVLGLLLAVASVSSAAWAQQPAPQPGGVAPPARMLPGPQRRQVSLREALQLAAKQGPDVAAARAQADVVRVGVERAWTAWQPNVSATGTFDHTNAFATFDLRPLGNLIAAIAAQVPNPVPVPANQFSLTTINAQNNWTGNIQLTQPILTPQGLFAPGIANAAAEAAERGSDEAREQVLLNVARAYLALQGLEGLLEAARDAEKVALRREQDAKARISAGTDVEIALLRAQTETAQARAQIAGLQGQKEATLPLLEALVGEPVEPGAPQGEYLGPPGEESAQPWERAFSVRSAISAASAAQRAVRLDQFAWLPSIAGIARENYNSNGGFTGKNWTYDLMVTATLPIYDRGERYAQLHEDEARLAQAQAQLASARARARSDWIGARANVAAAQAVLQQTESQAQLATRAQVQVDASYRAGVATSLDVSDADQKKFAAQSAAVQSRAQLEVRKAELAAAEGRLYEATR